MMNAIKVYTDASAAVLLKVSAADVVKLIESGKLPAKNMGNTDYPRYRILGSDLNDYIVRRDKAETRG